MIFFHLELFEIKKRNFWFFCDVHNTHGTIGNKRRTRYWERKRRGKKKKKKFQQTNAKNYKERKNFNNWENRTLHLNFEWTWDHFWIESLGPFIIRHCVSNFSRACMSNESQSTRDKIFWAFFGWTQNVSLKKLKLDFLWLLAYLTRIFYSSPWMPLEGKKFDLWEMKWKWFAARIIDY